MPQYVPHGISLVQNIFKQSRNAYIGYAVARDSGQIIFFRSANDRRSYEGLLKVWREIMLNLFLKMSFIDQVRADMIRSWIHSGFSVESETRLFTKADRTALGQYVVRGAISMDKVSYDVSTDTVSWHASEKGFFKGKV